MCYEIVSRCENKFRFKYRIVSNKINIRYTWPQNLYQNEPLLAVPPWFSYKYTAVAEKKKKTNVVLRIYIHR
jgi:hypothetical protein